MAGDTGLAGVAVVGNVLGGVVESGDRVLPSVVPVWAGEVIGTGRGVGVVVNGAGDGATGVGTVVGAVVGAVWARTERGYHATTAKLTSARQLV